MFQLPNVKLSSRAACALLAVCGAANAASFCVNPTGANGCAKTIGAAIAGASAGDTITVAPGTYKEAVVIGKSLSLIGDDATKVTIDATGLGVGIYINGNDNANVAQVLVSGFTVQNANFEGILAANVTNVLISGNIVQKNNLGLVVAASGTTCPNIPAYDSSEGQDCGEGIHLNGVTRSLVTNNTVQNNSGGILISDDDGVTHDNLITGNTVMNNLLACGITLASHPPAPLTKATAPLGVFNNSVVSNQISGNGSNGTGAGVGLFTSVPGAQTYGNVVVNNTITGNGLPGVTFHSHTPGQVLLGNAVIGNTISGNAGDTADATTPGTAGINVFGVSSIAGTLILQNTISQEANAVVVNGPGAILVERNNLTSGTGVNNIGQGTANADSNWWGCANNPTFPSSGLTGCSGVSGNVTVNVFTTAPIVK
jgi:parallel beta-helix repeat protein